MPIFPFKCGILIRPEIMTGVPLSYRSGTSSAMDVLVWVGGVALCGVGGGVEVGMGGGKG